MRLEDIDINLKDFGVTQQDVEWINVKEGKFSLYGVFYSEEEGCYKRLPKSVAEKVSPSVDVLSYNTAGGRIRFYTDSDYVAIKALIPYNGEIMRHMTLIGKYGFSVYSDQTYEGDVAPSIDALNKSKDGTAFFASSKSIGNGDHFIEIFLPLYGGIIDFSIGVKKGSYVKKDEGYKYEKPIVYYGSSITQGGCASRPGNDYTALISRWLDTDYINLGFSGSCKAEQPMVDYLASLDPSIFVLDYDHNAPNAEYLNKTHFNLYECIRNKHKDTPIIFISKPDCWKNNKKSDGARRKVIIETYKKALSLGDKNVTFIDGSKLFGNFNREGCTVDACHPNDLGFYRMAKGIAPKIKNILSCGNKI